MQFRRRQRGNMLIDVTPLIDVVFLLLIFFMVTTTFTWQSELTINLPEANGQSQASPNTIRVAVDSSGNYFVNDQMLTDNQRATLSDALQNATSAITTPKAAILIVGDALAPHQAIVTVLDVAGQLGFHRINITTQKPHASE